MRREIYRLVTAVVLVVFGMSDMDRVAAQQLIDPAPVAEGPELPSDLPLPEHSLVIQEPARDNSRAYFGVTFDPQVREAAVARSVSAGSPADLAGVKAGDAIISLNGREVLSYDDVLNTVARLKPGDVLDVEISRRVSVRARAVLDGQPVGVEHTTGYRAEPEALPAPADYRREPPVRRAPVNRGPASVAAPRPRQNYNAPQNRNPNANRGRDAARDNDSNDRERENRGRGFMRRRG